MAKRRKYPVGIQSFERIRKDGYVYVDKTPFIYKMITEGLPYFLSRPRRFGKSLLVSTLAAVFEGRRELFEAFTTEDGIEQPQLYIAQTDWRWEKYPVVRFDFSSGDLETIDDLDALIDNTLKTYEREYGIVPSVPNTNIRMEKIILEARRQTGHRVVVLCDEYDNMMLHSLGDAGKQRLVRQRFQNLFAPLKAMDDHLQFVFVTGISKFSQMGVFSKFNQLQNISMLPAYEAICGISEDELHEQLSQDISVLASMNGVDYEVMLTELKQAYDGYHFSSQLADMYNPFSLFSAFKSGEVNDYWFSSATPGALIDMLRQMPPLDLTIIDSYTCESSVFDRPFDSYESPLPVLYQSGYLTIKDYDRELNDYTLGMPNMEVRRGFSDCLYQVMTGCYGDDQEKSVFLTAFKRFRRDADLPRFISSLQAFFAGVPYLLNNQNERHYHALLYTLLMAFGADVVAEDMSAKGRADLTLRMPRGIYIIELKHDGTADEALRQIEARGYAAKYALDGRPVTKVALVFSSAEKNITEWKCQP